ncbi:MAG: isochorismatase family cysteine hydrolase [Sedimentibacter sp.]|uniref:isochorismatase family cysteine hydrolase n=1 Tax=Sedimentibacter sp. TaxID=1960295 RepID=UPI002980A4DA|nr:isochorismatase family cysteine hydrolase [Sedimentibacter sp.]MDW5300596.1 isochorismatase family cysteine hydrolase [Sedimentibacter sp.]
MDVLETIENELKGNTIGLLSLDKEKTALFIVDMVNGFVYSGPLSSPRVAAISKNVAELNNRTSDYKKVFFLDSHGKQSIEFSSFPLHCIKGSMEAELIPELKTIASNGPEMFYIEKNSTNGFFSKEFHKWLVKYEDEVDNYIITGCVTDICVLQFALSLKAYFNETNKSKRIIVPKNCVETYDGGSHDGYLMNLFALYNMHISGIEIVDKIN